MNCFYLLSCLLAASSLTPAKRAQVSAQGQTPEPKSSIEWFQQASDQMNIRMPGSSPFHMKVKFHAYPGQEFLGLGEKSRIVTGDGVYEETWVAPHQWRREVTFAGYHAVEAESEKGRKMQTSSDYEPSRVLMLLEALLQPIPRNLASREFVHLGAGGWRIQQFASDRSPVVCISKGSGNQEGEVTTAYYFTPKGLFLMSNEGGLVSQWQGEFLFAGKVVPKHIEISAGADRILVRADVSIESAGVVDASMFEQPGAYAEPGTTLRPLRGFEVHSDARFSAEWTTMGNVIMPHGFTIMGVLDRYGRYRDVEILLSGNDADVAGLLERLRANRSSPPTIDGSPCELAMIWAFI